MTTNLSPLLRRQLQFGSMVPVLLNKALDMGYQFKLGETFRPKETAELYERQNRGSANSLHTLGLAIDLHLFMDGKYLRQTEDHKPLGEFWESIGGTWGGRFGDGNHYSLAWGGRK